MWKLADMLDSTPHSPVHNRSDTSGTDDTSNEGTDRSDTVQVREIEYKMYPFNCIDRQYRDVISINSSSSCSLDYTDKPDC